MHTRQVVYHQDVSLTLYFCFIYYSVYITMFMWMSEGIFQESMLSFYYVGSGFKLKLSGMHGKCFCPLRHLISLIILIV